MKRQKQTRALFLDFDGVLHQPQAIAGAQPPLTPRQLRSGWPNIFVHLPILRQLLTGHTDVAVVVCSSWRQFLSEEELAELLGELEPWFAGAVRKGQRDLAIREWVHDHEIADFAVLDDVPKFYSGNWPELIVCDSQLGIADNEVQRRLAHWLG